MDKNITDPNYINNLGLETAYQDFTNYIKKFEEIMRQMNLFSEIFQELCKFLVYKVEQKFKNICYN